MDCDYQDMKKWLDIMVQINDYSRTAEWFNSAVNARMYESDIMINKGIAIIAEVLHLKLEESVNPVNDCATYSFEYDGVRFWEMMKPGERICI